MLFTNFILHFSPFVVIAIDIDPVKIEFARHNARIYGVQDRIEFIVGDFFKIAPRLRADVVFLSPPWGGPNYKRHSSFPLADIAPCGGKRAYRIARKISNHIALYLPRNINVDDVRKIDRIKS